MYLKLECEKNVSVFGSTFFSERWIELRKYMCMHGKIETNAIGALLSAA